MSQQRGEQMSFRARSLSERGAQQPFHQLQDIIYSPKHTALYIYLIRLLKPIWKKKCIITPEGVSSLTYQNCADILCELRALKAFIEEIPLNNFSGKCSMSKSKEDSLTFDLSAEFSTTNALNNEYGQNNATQQRNTLEQAVINDEKRSINALSLFISMHSTFIDY